MPSDDSTLWRRASAGDSVAYSELFARHADAIYNFCFRRTGDWAGSEDLVSIVFMEAWRRRGAQLQPGKVLPWLYGVATNVVRNRRRSERRYAAALARMPAPRPHPDFSEEVDAALDSESAMRQILAALQQLPKREQDVFVLCGWCDLSYEDAALALEIPVGTVRSRLSRARHHLRELGVGSGHVQAKAILEGASE